MSKEEFLEILSRQQRSGLSIKDFCINEAYTESSFYYWKGKFGLSRAYHTGRSSSEEFAPVNLTSPLRSNPTYDRTVMESGEIRIEFPGGIIARLPYYTNNKRSDLKELLPNNWKQKNSKEI